MHREQNVLIISVLDQSYAILEQFFSISVRNSKYLHFKHSAVILMEINSHRRRQAVSYRLTVKFMHALATKYIFFFPISRLLALWR